MPVDLYVHLVLLNYVILIVDCFKQIKENSERFAPVPMLQAYGVKQTQ